VRENWEANGFPYSPFTQEIHPPIQLLIFGDGPDNESSREFLRDCKARIHATSPTAETNPIATTH